MISKNSFNSPPKKTVSSPESRLFLKTNDSYVKVEGVNYLKTTSKSGPDPIPPWRGCDQPGVFIYFLFCMLGGGWWRCTLNLYLILPRLAIHIKI